MNAARYREAAALAANWIRGLYPRAISIERLPRARVPVGIYIPCGPDGRVRYVGSAVRPGTSNGLACRVNEHSLRRRGTWRYVWVIPLWDDTPREVVRAIEGQIIDFLGLPADNRARHLPRHIPHREHRRERAGDVDMS